ncbi:hypothetical protein C7E12_22985, partial [Stenotrophomonas maltophilia]
LADRQHRVLVDTQLMQIDGAWSALMACSMSSCNAVVWRHLADRQHRVLVDTQLMQIDGAWSALMACSMSSC